MGTGGYPVERHLQLCHDGAAAAAEKGHHMGGGHEVAAFAQPEITLVSGGEGDVQLLGAPDHAVGRLNETGLHLAAAVGTLHHKCSFHTAPDGALRWLYINIIAYGRALRNA